MGFVFTANNWMSDIERICEPDYLAYVVRVGHHAGTGMAYFVSTQMHYPPPGYELMFSMIEVSTFGEQRHIMDSGEVMNIIPTDIRKISLDMLLHLVDETIKDTLPEHVCMNSFLKDLPPKLLVKYERICQIFEAHGYQISRDTGPDGHPAWRMNL